MPRTLNAAPRSRRHARGGLAALLLASTVLALPLLGHPAAAQQIDSRALLQRIERLESDLAILQRQTYLGGGGAPPRPGPSGSAGGEVNPGVAASFEARISALEDQMQGLTGRLEEIGHQADVVKSQLERLQKDIEFRLSALERGGAAGSGGPSPAPGAAPSGTAPPGGTSGPQAAAPGTRAGAPEPSPPPQRPVAGSGQVLPVGTPQQQYDYARALLVQQDYGGAEKSFQAFVNTHPDDPLAGAAQYWLGQTYYVRANYDAAAKVFAEGYQRYPKSDKAPDTLLKLGMSLVQLNRKKDACILFNELNQRYPNAPGNVRQLAQRERERAGCS